MAGRIHPQWIVPDWPAPPPVRALITTRAGGSSTGAYAAADGGGMNVGLSSGDGPDTVRANRALLRALLPEEPRWLRQVHGADVLAVDEPNGESNDGPTADAATARKPGTVCVVTVADCLPVLLTDRQGRIVGAAHAGWRGLAAGVIGATVAQMRARLGEQAEMLAYLGPAIGPEKFEVGPEVRAAMRSRMPRADEAFTAGRGDRLFADLFALARQALADAGGIEVYGGGLCTASDAARFYSFRRDRITGRHAALVWIAPEAAGSPARFDTRTSG